MWKGSVAYPFWSGRRQDCDNMFVLHYGGYVPTSAGFVSGGILLVGKGYLHGYCKKLCEALPHSKLDPRLAKAEQINTSMITYLSGEICLATAFCFGSSSFALERSGTGEATMQTYISEEGRVGGMLEQPFLLGQWWASRLSSCSP